MFNQGGSSFQRLEKAIQSAGDFTKGGRHTTSSVVNAGTVGYGDRKYLIGIFTTSIIIGALLGVCYATQLLRPDSLGSTIASALAYGALGGFAGLLVAGLVDIIFAGSLDDRLDIDEQTIYTIAAETTDDLVQVSGLMHKNNPNEVYNYNFASSSKALIEKST